jgi:hypothetical protein
VISSGEIVRDDNLEQALDIAMNLKPSCEVEVNEEELKRREERELEFEKLPVGPVLHERVQDVLRRLREKRKTEPRTPESVISPEEIEKGLDQRDDDQLQYCTREEPEKPIDPELQRRIREAMKEIRERKR